jgi:hypothetical protein
MTRPAAPTASFLLRLASDTMSRPIESLMLAAGLALVCAAHARAQSAPPLGAAADFAVLGASTVTNTGATVLSSGHVGVAPGTAITGFPPGVLVGGAVHAGDATAQQAQLDLAVAASALAADACTVDLSGVDLGGRTLVPGVYCFSSSAQLTGTLTLDAQEAPDAVFIFQLKTTLTTAASAAVVMTNGGRSGGVFWQVGTSATIGAGTTFAGSILASVSITLGAGASISGRALAQTGAVTLTTNAVSVAPFGSSTGDPHLITFDGLYYDLQAAGDFILVRTPSLEVQVRQDWWPTNRRVAVNVAAAARLDSDRVVVYRDPSRVSVNGVPMTPSSSLVTLPSGATVSVTRELVRLAGPNGGVTFQGPRYLNIRVDLAPSETAVTGLLGDRDGSARNDLVTREGRALVPPITRSQRYDLFGVSWVVPVAESLFDDATSRAAPALQSPSAEFTVENLSDGERDAAEEDCATAGVSDPTLRAGCTLDVAVMGEPRAAEAFLRLPAPTLVVEARDGPLALQQGACSTSPRTRSHGGAWGFLVAAVIASLAKRARRQA